MPLPSISDQHIDAYLTGLSVGFSQAETNFVADQAFPNVASQKKSDKLATYSRADLYRSSMELRAPGAESAGGGYRVSRDSFLIDVFALHQDVDDQTVAGADNPYAPVEDATRFLVQQEKLKKEVTFATDFFASSKWTGGTSADPTAASLSAAWDDPSSTPIEDLTEQGNSVLVKTGFLPNTLVVNYLGWTALKNHPDVVDRVKYTTSEPVTTQNVANLIGVDKVLVSKATRNTAAEGLAASYSSILGNSALLVYSASSPGLYQPSGGYTFTWAGYPGSADGRRIKRFYLDANSAWRIEIESAFDLKLIDADLGVFITSVAS